MKKDGTKSGGKPKGYKAPKTLEKEAIRDHIRARVSADLDPLLDAQIANAKGLFYLVARDPKSGKFEKVEASELVSTQEGGAAVEVWQKDPSVAAFSDLINRAADKPKEQEQEIKITGTLNIDTRIRTARLRLKSTKH